eukprot:COSAG06_NODE_383_length_16525_cov_86.720017_3_plen_64_part_00
MPSVSRTLLRTGARESLSWKPVVYTFAVHRAEGHEPAPRARSPPSPNGDRRLNQSRGKYSVQL